MYNASILLNNGKTSGHNSFDIANLCYVENLDIEISYWKRGISESIGKGLWGVSESHKQNCTTGIQKKKGKVFIGVALSILFEQELEL